MLIPQHNFFLFISAGTIAVTEWRTKFRRRMNEADNKQRSRDLYSQNFLTNSYRVFVTEFRNRVFVTEFSRLRHHQRLVSTRIFFCSFSFMQVLVLCPATAIRLVFNLIESSHDQDPAIIDKLPLPFGTDN